MNEKEYYKIKSIADELQHKIINYVGENVDSGTDATRMLFELSISMFCAAVINNGCKDVDKAICLEFSDVLKRATLDSIEDFYNGNFETHKVINYD